MPLPSLGGVRPPSKYAYAPGRKEKSGVSVCEKVCECDGVRVCMTQCLLQIII